MPLPHPHGSASGQIGHNASFDTGVTPGSTGGKFIGFGEEGTSAIANRSHWALSENIDFVYGKLITDKAIPSALSYIADGAATKQATGLEVWVGDGTYPGGPTSDPEGMLLLYSVLDDQYNELTDGSGNEVRVKEVRDSGNVSDVYQDGFELSPTFSFRTVNPTTGATVNNNYSIPNLTDVRILLAVKGNLEALPVDAFIKFKTHSGAEVEAGAFLQDGTRKMTGDLDLDNNKLINADEVLGVAANPLLVRAFTDLTLQGDQALTLKDQYLSSAMALSESGESALYQPGSQYSSLVGSVNSKSRLAEGIHGNRTLVKGGALTFTGASGLIALPAGMIVSLNGEAVDVGGQSFTATATGVRVGVINSSGTFVERATTAAVLQTDVPVASYVWDGVSTFTTSIDIRWTLNNATEHLEVTLGPGADADFSDFQEAVDAIGALEEIFQASVTTAPKGSRTAIRVRGTVEFSSKVTLNSGTAYSIYGDNNNDALKYTGGGVEDCIDAAGAVLKPCVTIVFHKRQCFWGWSSGLLLVQLHLKLLRGNDRAWDLSGIREGSGECGCRSHDDCWVWQVGQLGVQGRRCVWGWDNRVVHSELSR
jgi:hypothetical protein